MIKSLKDFVFFAVLLMLLLSLSGCAKYTLVKNYNTKIGENSQGGLSPTKEKQAVQNKTDVGLLEIAKAKDLVESLKKDVSELKYTIRIVVIETFVKAPSKINEEKLAARIDFIKATEFEGTLQEQIPTELSVGIAKHETDDFKSYAFKKRHNPFGIMSGGKTKTFTDLDKAIREHLDALAKMNCYRGFQKQLKKGANIDVLVASLANAGYAEDPNWQKCVLREMKEKNNPFVSLK